MTEPEEEKQPSLEERQTIHEQRKAQEQKETNTNIYYGIRFIEMVCIGIAVFGAMWEGAERFNLTTPQFMIIYGGVGAGISEIIARLFKKKIIK